MVSKEIFLGSQRQSIFEHLLPINPTNGVQATECEVEDHKGNVYPEYRTLLLGIAMGLLSLIGIDDGSGGRLGIWVGTEVLAKT